MCESSKFNSNIIIYAVYYTHTHTFFFISNVTNNEQLLTMTITIVSMVEDHAFY